jgi:hypothetical protein
MATRKKRRRVKHPLQELREFLGWKPAQLGDSIDRTRTFVSMVEADRTELGRESVIALFDRFRPQLDQLGITAEDLLRGRRVPRPDGDGARAA